MGLAWSVTHMLSDLIFSCHLLAKKKLIILPYLKMSCSLTLLFSCLKPRWPSSTLTASSALLCLPPLPWEPPTHASAPSTRRLCHSPHCNLSSATVIAPFGPRRAPCTSPSSVYPPPLWFKCPAGAAPALGSPDPASPHTGTRGLGAEAPSTRDAAEDGGPEAQDDAAPHVSTTVTSLCFFLLALQVSHQPPPPVSSPPLQTSTRASAAAPPQNAPQLRPWAPHPRATNYVFPPSPARAENSLVSIRQTAG